MSFFQKQKPLNKRPDDERPPSLKNPIDRRLFVIFSVVVLIAVAILIGLLIYINSLGLI